MPYKTLYKRRQSEPEFLVRKWYMDDALELSWVSGLTIKVSKRLDKERVRGLIISHGPNFINGLEANYTIIVAEDLAPEMERFIIIKEIMHCYFGPNGGSWATDTSMSLDNHMRKFFGNSATVISAADEAEKKALWMAIGVLCPEHTRLEYQRAVMHDHSMTYDDVARKLMIPLHTAKALLSKQFEDEITHILK
ncbi:MAG: hypothetical protein U1E68_09295 [Sphingomonadaceae bacterium]